MLTTQQKLELRAGLSQHGGSSQAEAFAAELARAKQSGKSRWLRGARISRSRGYWRELPSKAVDEALAIVRSASLTDIDWMKEPPSDGVRSAVAKQ
jgi:hypothetical protein